MEVSYSDFWKEMSKDFNFAIMDIIKCPLEDFEIELVVDRYKCTKDFVLEVLRRSILGEFASRKNRVKISDLLEQPKSKQVIGYHLKKKGLVLNDEILIFKEKVKRTKLFVIDRNKFKEIYNIDI